VILIAYDGSPDSKAAVQHAGELFPGQPATVLTVWQPFADVIARTPSGFGWAPGEVDYEAVDTAARQSAEQHAAEGAKLARAAGLDAQPRISEERTTTAKAILAEADAIDASAVVMGSRGLTGLKSLLLGSVSHAVLQHADRTVIVVPSPDVSAGRRDQQRE
jgi:nucleotide-binding universal stress UspA family protein